MSIERESRPPLEEWFCADGHLSRVVDGYESREAQLDLAEDIYRTLRNGGAFLGEAPTGVGKSLAYLIPAYLWSRAHGETVVISTYTKSLQNQLLRQDIPRLLAGSGETLRAVVLKGKSNYYCARRHRLLAAEQKRTGFRRQKLENDFLAWVAGSEEGDLEDFPWHQYQGGPSFRARVAADPSFCGEAVCRSSRDCCFRQARKRAASADLLIVNHALLISGMAAGGVLPPFRTLIIDEAQHLESSLTSQLTRSVSHNRFVRALDAWGSGRRRSSGLLGELDTGLLAPAQGEAGRDLAELAAELRELRSRILETAKRFFASLALAKDEKKPYAPRARFETQQTLLDSGLDGYDELVTQGERAERMLVSLAATLGRLESSPSVEDWRADAEGALGEWRNLLQDLELVADPRGREFVHWRSGSETERIELAAAPVEIKTAVSDWLWKELSSVVLVSATLRVDDRFDYLRSRLGLGESSAFTVETATYPTPFDWPSQVMALVPGAGEPNTESVCQLVARLHHRSPRNTLVLFTSHAALRAARRLLAQRLAPGTVLWAQGVDGEAPDLAERFRHSRGAVLLGTASFWEGVDFPGAALEVLVVAKLPFSVPDDPLIEARSQRIEEEGGSGFRDYLLPEAVLRFRQGVGRLLRRRTDRGILVVADTRSVSRSYGQVFRGALPMPLQVVRDGDDLVQRAAEFLQTETDGPTTEWKTDHMSFGRTT